MEEIKCCLDEAVFSGVPSRHNGELGNNKWIARTALSCRVSSEEGESVSVLASTCRVTSVMKGLNYNLIHSLIFFGRVGE